MMYIFGLGCQIFSQWDTVIQSGTIIESCRGKKCWLRGAILWENAFLLPSAMDGENYSIWGPWIAENLFCELLTVGAVEVLWCGLLWCYGIVMLWWCSCVCDRVLIVMVLTVGCLVLCCSAAVVLVCCGVGCLMFLCCYVACCGDS